MLPIVETDGILQTVTGIVDTPTGKWYVVGGKLNAITGNVAVNGVNYKLSNGKVVG